MARRLAKGEARAENRAIWAFVVIVALMVGLALYGYLTGGWDASN